MKNIICCLILTYGLISCSQTNLSEQNDDPSVQFRGKKKPSFSDVSRGQGWVKTSHRIRSNRYAYYPNAPEGKWVEFCKTKHPVTGDVPEVDFETIENQNDREGGWVKVIHGFGALVFHDHAPELFAPVPHHTRVVADWDYGIPVKIYDVHRTTDKEVLKKQIGKSAGLALGAGAMAGVVNHKVNQVKEAAAYAYEEKMERERLELEKRERNENR